MSEKDTVLEKLSCTHSVHNLNIISSSKINLKVKRILSLLDVAASTPPSRDGGKPATRPAPIVVCLCAKAAVASKLITIAEIVKREFGRLPLEGVEAGQTSGMPKKKREIVRLFQYSAVGSALEASPEKKSKGELANGGKKRNLDAAHDGGSAHRRKRFKSTGVQSTELVETDRTTTTMQDQISEPHLVKVQLPAIVEQQLEHTFSKQIGDDSILEVANVDGQVVHQQNTRTLTEENTANAGNATEDEDEAFYETYKPTPTAAALIADGSSPRAAPLIKVFLCRTAIKLLKDAYGEQTT